MKICIMSPTFWNWCLRESYIVCKDVLENRQVGRTFKLVNPKHEDQLKNFLKYFFLLFKQSWYKINKTEYVKNQKTKYVIQKSEHIFKICIGCIVHNDIFLKVIFSLWCSMFCDMFYLLYYFAFAELKCFCSLSKLMCLLPNTL